MNPLAEHLESRLTEALARVAALEAEKARGFVPEGVWHDGCPPNPYGSEWFIARLDNGQRVVLKELYDEHSYDYRTADETYYSAYRIAAWMQFQDSDYIAAPAPAERVEQEPYGWTTAEPDGDGGYQHDFVVASERPNFGVTPLYLKPASLIDEGSKTTTTQPSPAPADPWQPSCVEYDRSIHYNPDAKAWADLFVQTFPGHAGQHDLMVGWFANAMMAMHDWLKAKEPAPAAHNPEHTLFNEIRISEPVNEDGEETRYLISEQQLQRIRLLEAPAAPDVAGLVEALRQYRHNDGSDGFVFGYDKEMTDRYVAGLAQGGAADLERIRHLVDLATAAHFREMESRTTGLVEALEEIVSPVTFMKKRLKSDEKLEGFYAQQLSSDPNYLKQIAARALAAHRQQEG